jgi:hypothetical protein
LHNGEDMNTPEAALHCFEQLSVIEFPSLLSTFIFFCSDYWYQSYWRQNYKVFRSWIVSEICYSKSSFLRYIFCFCGPFLHPFSSLFTDIFCAIVWQQYCRPSFHFFLHSLCFFVTIQSLKLYQPLHIIMRLEVSVIITASLTSLVETRLFPWQCSN